MAPVDGEPRGPWRGGTGGGAAGGAGREGGRVGGPHQAGASGARPAEKARVLRRRGWAVEKVDGWMSGWPCVPGKV